MKSIPAWAIKVCYDGEEPFLAGIYFFEVTGSPAVTTALFKTRAMARKAKCDAYKGGVISRGKIVRVLVSINEVKK